MLIDRPVTLLKKPMILILYGGVGLWALPTALIYNDVMIPFVGGAIRTK